MILVMVVAENNMEFLFTSHFSLGQSILTLEDDKDKDGNELIGKGPASIVSIARKHKLPYVNLVDTSMSGFIQAYENLSKYNIELRFGYKVCVCSDMNDKTEESINTESNVIIWCLNSNGYADLVKIATKAACDGFYYNPRIDWETLKTLWSNNLAISFPFYSSFIARNILKYKSICFPDFSFTTPNFLVENHDLPFDSIILNAINNFNSSLKFNTVQSKTCYYYKKEDLLKHQIIRCINNRTKTDKPGLDHYSVDNFCFLDTLDK
ncbi:MAG: PHP domain-containing protein [Proteobacteria bacterium]|nr:MAG: PHP domain-containing protein [Pseudomonadota bacterium]